MPEKMKALVLMGPDHQELKMVPVPKPGPQEVLIQVESCAVCSTDVALIHKAFPGQPPYGVHITGPADTAVMYLHQHLQGARGGNR
ncbi:MAG: hypothetical protein PHT01_04775, partial [Spirochaetales bacterium]|nr:hypothetical protein [Spirochaetales bacterium]